VVTPALVVTLGLLGGCTGQAFYDAGTGPAADGGVTADASGPGPEGGVAGTAADTTGLWAMRVALKVRANVIGTEQQLSSTLILRSQLTESGEASGTPGPGQETGPRAVELSTTLCDFQLPQIPNFPAHLVIPTELLAAVGAIPSRATRDGASFQGDPQAVTIGVVLADPLGDPLPAPVMSGGTGDCAEASPGEFCDQETDGKIGGTLLFDPPFNAGVIKLAKVYAGARTVVHLAGTITAGGAAIVGQIPAADIKLETVILGCQKCEVRDGPQCDAPADCGESEVMMVAALNPNARADEGSELVAVRLDDPLECDEIVARQAGLFR
jgi:hypothetical protein